MIPITRTLFAYATLLSIGFSGTSAFPQASDGTELQTCLINAVGGDAARARFTESPGFLEQNVRVYNGNYKYIPAAVTYPSTSQEVSAIVKCAAGNGRKVQARSGGHDYINKGIGGANGAIVVDMKNFQNFEMDASTGIATVGPGTILESLINRLHENGARSMPHGVFPTVAVGGHATVGGFGFSARREGLTLDKMRNAEVVLANGTIVRASASENVDLFWAIRGAGQSFGIVTEFNFQTQPQPPEIWTYSYSVSSNNAKDLADAVKSFNEIIRDPSLPKELSVAGNFINNSFTMSGQYYGSRDQFNAINIPGRFSRVDTTTVIQMTWIELYRATLEEAGGLRDRNATGVYFYAKDAAVPFGALPSNSSIDALLKLAVSGDPGKSNWFFRMDVLGGATREVPASATAFPHRETAYFFQIMATTDDETPAETLKFADEIIKLGSGADLGTFGSYVGSSDARILGTPQEKYWGLNLGRLQDIKTYIDPNDVFSTPQGVKPKV